MHTRLTLPLAALTLWACASARQPAADAAPAASPPTAAGTAAPTETFAWPGTYDVVATGFPEGSREAVMEIARRDTAYTLTVRQGPPGQLESMRIAGDSAHFVWNLGGDFLYLDLRGAGDALSGRWRTADQCGEVVGTRRR